MVTKFVNPVVIQAAGNLPKMIKEYVGRESTRTDTLSIARMTSPSGWEEPFQRPEFDEYTVVFDGFIKVETEKDVLEVAAGQALLVRAGELVRYSTPGPKGAEYVSVCLPAFSPETVHREPS